MYYSRGARGCVATLPPPPAGHGVRRLERCRRACIYHNIIRRYAQKEIPEKKYK